jgi:hypothetical protein
MPKVKWGIDTSEPEELEQFAAYEGEIPSANVYRGKITRLTLKENKNGDDMLNGLFIIAEPKGSTKAKFNGAPIWFNQNITEQGKPYVLLFLKAFGLTWADFLNKTVTDTNERPAKVMKIGTVKFNDGNEPMCRLQSKIGKDQNDEKRADIRAWLPPKVAEESTDWDSGDDDVPDDDEPVF